MKRIPSAFVITALLAPCVLAMEETERGIGKLGAGASASPPLEQKTSPVTGKPIVKTVSVEYEGRRVFFCCNKCPDEFKKSPARYLPALYRQVYPQTVQVKCPVMGDAVDGRSFVEHKGHRIALCCGICVSKFKADPAKYLARLKEYSTDQVHCPVTGQAIVARYHMRFKGKDAYFASEDSLNKFKTDSAAYADNLLPPAGLVARGATADDDRVLCPVCASGGGSPHGRKGLKAAVHDGKMYFFCNDACAKEFKASPAKYVKAVNDWLRKHAGT